MKRSFARAIPRHVLCRKDAAQFLHGSVACSTRSAKTRHFYASYNVDTRRHYSTPGSQSDLAEDMPLKDMLSLKDKVTVVTGGARGIGLALANVSAELGSDIAIIDTLEKPHHDYEKLSEFGGKVKYYRYDAVSQPGVS